MRIDASAPLHTLTRQQQNQNTVQPQTTGNPNEDAVSIPELLGGIRKLEQLYERLYNKEQFTKTDTDGDGQLSPEELEARKDWVSGYGSFNYEKRIKEADTNNDGHISLEEAQVKKKSELTQGHEIYQELQDKADMLAYRRRAISSAEQESGYNTYLEDNPIAGRILNHYSQTIADRTDRGREFATFEKYLQAYPKVARYAEQHTDFFERIFQ